MKYILTYIIKAYQILVSPILPANCRFYPTCSDYFIQALNRHGFFIGSYLGIRRILKCHPFNPGGYDPVPQEKGKL
ncbi:MAG: membrane protein insertion efficiency factor YidD [Anaerovoracaceae bacterium]